MRIEDEKVALGKKIKELTDLLATEKESREK
jgi:hypothetical protein